MSDFQINYATLGAAGQSGGLTDADDAFAVVSVSNNGFMEGTLTVAYTLNDGRTHEERVESTPGSEQLVTWAIGTLPAGSYNAQIAVGVELEQTTEYVGSEEVYVEVQPSAAPEPAAPAHDPNDYRLELGQISMHTEGGGIVHAEDEAFATERVIYYAEIVNNTYQYLGPYEVQFLVDGQDVGWGGTSEMGVGPGESAWAQGSTDTLSVGNHTLEIRVVSAEPDLFVGSSQTIDLRVLEPHDPRAMDEGEEVGRDGWAQRQVYIGVRDFTGRGLNGPAYVEFSGPGGKSAEKGQVVNGDLSLDAVWAPDREGRITITINSDVANLTLTGGDKFEDGDGAISLDFTQAKRRQKYTFQSSEEFTRTIGMKVEAGIDIKVFSAGGEISGELSWGTTIVEGVEYEFWFPTENLESSARATAEQR